MYENQSGEKGCRYWDLNGKKGYYTQTEVPFIQLIGTLRFDNGDVHVNVAEKQTSHHFKLFRDYPNSSCYFKEGDFGRS